MLGTSCAFSQGTWPSVKPVDKTALMVLPDIDNPNRFEQQSGSRTIDVVVVTPRDIPIYKIECGTPDRSNGHVFEYSGDFQCRMIPWGKESSSSDLLSEVPKSTHDWQSRARFFANEVLGLCGSVPDFGRVRTFRLRGMKITLTMSNVEADESGRVPTLREFDFRVAITPDPTAVSHIAEPPVVDPKWRSTKCPLDDSVEVHFAR